MTGREKIIVSRVLPYEAASMAPSIEHFLVAAAQGTHPDTAALLLQSDPVTEDAIRDRQALIEASGRLRNPGEEAYVVARETDRPEYSSGVVGLGVFRRGHEEDIVVGGLHVLSGYRGRHIGPAILNAALRQLDISPWDRIIAEVPERDQRSRQFVERIGFVGEPGPRILHEDQPPFDSILFRNYEADQVMLQASVQALLDYRPPSEA